MYIQWSINHKFYIMKLNYHSKAFNSLITANYLLLSCFIAFMFFSCSAPDGSVDLETMNKNVETANLKAGIHYETWQDQIDRLTKKTQRFNNFQVAVAQGWGEAVSEHVTGMGVHYLNPDLADDQFELEKPEALLYVQTSEGKQFVGVEYLIFGLSPDGPAPEGFIGDNDVWFYNTDVEAWTLHAWVALENSNGVFAPTNPDVENLKN